MPLAIVNKAHQANQMYPFAISLIESVRTYERTLEKVSHALEKVSHALEKVSHALEKVSRALGLSRGV